MADREIRARLENAEIRAEDGEIRVSGYAAIFGEETNIGGMFTEVIERGAFKNAIARQDDVVFLINHDGLPLARTRSGTLTLTEDERGLRVDMALPQTSYGADIEQLVRAGIVHSYSFGFSVPSGGDAFSADGSTRELREIRLHEVSIVTGFPAYPATDSAQVRTTEELPAEPADEPAPGRSVALAQRYLALNAKR